ncbi:MAG: hypothetical protein II201_00810, partial [Clostridia bacterium]|nr:hypothetical protein [Clostridia bacterium]
TNSKIIELWGKSKIFEINFDKQYGNLFYADVTLFFLEDFFKDAPYWVDVRAISGGGLIFTSIREVTNKTITLYIANTRNEKQNITFMIRARGKWGGYEKPTTEV